LFQCSKATEPAVPVQSAGLKLKKEKTKNKKNGIIAKNAAQHNVYILIQETIHPRSLSVINDTKTGHHKLQSSSQGK